MAIPASILGLNGPLTLDINVSPGAAIHQAVKFTDSDEDPINLGADTTGQVQIRTSYGGTLLATGAVSVDAVNGSITATFTPESTASLVPIADSRDDTPLVKCGVWDVLLADVAGNKTVPVSGTVFLMPRVTT